MPGKTTNKPLSVLEISASGRYKTSVSRALTRDLIAALEARHGSVDVTVRDLAAGLPFVDEEWIDAARQRIADRVHAIEPAVRQVA